MQGVEGELLIHTGPLKGAPLPVSRAGMTWQVRMPSGGSPFAPSKGSKEAAVARGRVWGWLKGKRSTHSGWCRWSEVMGVFHMSWQGLLKEWNVGCERRESRMTSRSSACAPGGELMFMETGGPGAQLTGSRAAEFTSGRTQRRPWFPSWRCWSGSWMYKWGQMRSWNLVNTKEKLQKL